MWLNFKIFISEAPLLHSPKNLSMFNTCLIFTIEFVDHLKFSSRTEYFKVNYEYDVWHNLEIDINNLPRVLVVCLHNASNRIFIILDNFLHLTSSQEVVGSAATSVSSVTDQTPTSKPITFVCKSVSCFCNRIR